MNYFNNHGVAALLRHAASVAAVFPLRAWTAQPGVILRHDVDLDVQAAYAFSRLVAECGIRSTFFFLVTAETYNVNAAPARRMLRAMADDGFEVALHFDPQVYPEADAALLARHARTEGDILADIIGGPVTSISLHNPSVHGSFMLLDGWNNAYDPAIFGPDRYLSDSRMRFRSDPLAFVAQGAERIVQLLLHPLHYSQSGGPYPLPMLNYLERQTRMVDTMFRVNSEYQDRVGDRLLGALTDAVPHWKL
ncbi:MAG: hypothetical protein FD176_269 [Rhodospirillaceae bacterium]|nr:MAG: hypothetical protein FD176_269 [Rhodospirillaceae bacterium]TNC97481.1 MAG: Uncharacterized protein FD119_1081 [Stygiobacter sp.]